VYFQNASAIHDHAVVAAPMSKLKRRLVLLHQSNIAIMQTHSLATACQARYRYESNSFLLSVECSVCSALLT